MTCRTDTGEGITESEGEKVQQWNQGAHPCCIRDTVKPDENKAAEEEQVEGEELQHDSEQRGRDRGRPPMLRKKKSSYDLRDIFQYQEAEASKSKVSSPVASNVSSPDPSKVSSPNTEAPPSAAKE